jgi:hypothetical protein
MLDLAGLLKSVIAELTYLGCAYLLESVSERHFVGRFPSFKEVTFTEGVFQNLETTAIISPHLLFVSAKLNEIRSLLDLISEVILLLLFSVGVEAEGLNMIDCLSSWV